MIEIISNCVKCGNSKSYCNDMIMIDKRIATLIYSALNVANA